MRKFVENALEGFRRPLSLAHGGGLAHGPENRLGTISACLKFKPDVVEIDSRKSRDGVLFCHHGSIPFGVAFWAIVPPLPFSWVQRIVPGVNTLEEIAAIIPPGATLYVDVKDASIGGEDVRKALLRCRARAVWIAAYSAKHLESLRNDLGDQYIFVLNRPVFFIRRALKMRRDIVDVFQIFIWNYNAITLKEIENAGYGYHLARWFTCRGKHELQLKNRDLWLTYDSLEKTYGRTGNFSG